MELSHPILHLRASSGNGSASAPDPLARLGAEADVCADVYRALSRLCTARTAGPRAVIVCVDDLAPLELEFFPVLKQACPDLEVYVYSRRSSSDRIDTAIDLGADGRATEELLADLAGRLECASAPGETDQAERTETPDSTPTATEPRPTIVATKNADASPGEPSVSEGDTDGVGHQRPPSIHTNIHTPAVGAPDLEADGADTDASDDPDDPDDDTLQAPARVPWLRRQDAPARTAPPRDPAPPKLEEPTEPEPPEDDPHQPLLTEEELRALIGDDLAEDPPGETGSARGDGKRNSGAGS